MSSSSSSTDECSYNVFLSFRGPDTREGFIGYLYKALCDKGISTFIDDEELMKGEEITSTIMEAIKESRIAIVVFSKDYASSAFCLEELATIMEDGGQVWPVFYRLEPSVVRHQSGTYAKSLARHETRVEEDKVQKWKLALKEAADISGWHFPDSGYRYEYELVDDIVEEVFKEINHSQFSSYADNYADGSNSFSVQKRMAADYRRSGPPSLQISVFHQSSPSAPGSVGAYPPRFPPPHEVMSMVQQRNPASSYGGFPMDMPELDYHGLNVSIANRLNLGPDFSNGIHHPTPSLMYDHIHGQHLPTPNQWL